MAERALLGVRHAGYFSYTNQYVTYGSFGKILETAVRWVRSAPAPPTASVMTSSPAFALARYGAPSPDPILRRRRGRSPSPIVRSAKILAKWGQTPLTRTFPWARSAQKVSDPNFSMQLFFGVRRYHRLIFLNSRQQRTRGFLNSGGSVFHLRV